MSKMKKRDVEKLQVIKNKHGRSWKKLFRIRRNYPFGKKSNPIIIIERK